jgi:hypothetical protein
LAIALAVSPGAFFEFETEEVDSQILRDKLAGALENKDTKQLQQALRLIKALDIG